MKNFLLVVCFVSVCFLSYGQSPEYIRLYHGDSYVVPSDEGWRVDALSVDQIITVYDSVPCLFQIAARKSPLLYGIHFPYKAVPAVVGAFPFFLSNGTDFDVYCPSSKYILVEVVED